MTVAPRRINVSAWSCGRACPARYVDPRRQPDLRWIGEKTNEYLDNFVCDSVDRMDLRVHGIPRSGRTDSPPPDFRGDFAHPAFRNGPPKDGVIRVVLISSVLWAGTASAKCPRFLFCLEKKKKVTQRMDVSRLDLCAEPRTTFESAGLRRLTSRTLRECIPAPPFAVPWALRPQIPTDQPRRRVP